jgi:RES domain-containing protein
MTVLSTRKPEAPYKYALEPLSSQGSLVDPGGRFNIGLIDPIKFAPFPALYIASNKDTALQEMLCQKPDPDSKLTPHEFALTDTSSITIVSVSGSLERVINLDREEALKEFVGLINDFQYPKRLIREARERNFRLPDIVRTVGNLKRGLLTENWRAYPMQVDIPSMSQIFGQLVHESGIEGIVYPSKFTDKDCLAVFPRNFADSSSYVELDDPAPPEAKTRRLDKNTLVHVIDIV